jgi:hypothetical protein
MIAQKLENLLNGLSADIQAATALKKSFAGALRTLDQLQRYVERLKADASRYGSWRICHLRCLRADFNV